MKPFLAFLSACFCLLPMAGQAADLSLEWPHHGHDTGSMRYSPLRQITPQNVDKLQKVWSFHMRPANVEVPAADPRLAEGATSRRASRFLQSEATPLVIDGKMIVGTPYGRIVALNSQTGVEIWTYQLPDGDVPAMRGVEYWPSGKRIVATTRSAKLIELSVETGKPVPGFGTNGVLDLKTPDVMNGHPDVLYSFSSPPLVIGDVIVTGSRVQEAPTFGASGDVRAWDVRTGKKLWTFHVIPQPGEPGHETWEGDSWKDRSGVNVWTAPIGDAERGIVYLPVGAPTFDRWGADRHGANLYGNAIVALNAKTGKYLWHFQTVHHDIWDLDLPAASLIEVKQGGKTVPGIAVMNKTAILFMLNRVTGKPLYEIKEVAVPTETDIPNEQVWPTQPMSVTPPLSKLTYDNSDLANVTPEHRAYCEKLAKDKTVTASKMFQPLRADSAVASFPGSLGGSDWGGAAFDPARGIYVANTNNLAALAQMVKRPDGSYGMKDGYAYFWNPATRQPCSAPPWGNLNAVDVNTGKILWQVTLGVSDDLPAGQQNTGRVNIGNPMITAGGLAFIGATDDNRFRAFDSANGKELWSFKLEGMANTGPVSYQGKDGRQYVAVIATGGNSAGVPATTDEITAFALPK